MSDVWKILLTSLSTAFLGLLAFMLGQLFLRLYVDPIQELHKAIGEVSYALVFYADIYGNPPLLIGPPIDGAAKKARAVMDAIRHSASRLFSAINSIRRYDLVEQWEFVPPRKDCLEAASLLIGLSNSILSPDSQGEY